MRKIKKEGTLSCLFDKPIKASLYGKLSMFGDYVPYVILVFLMHR